MITVHTMGVWYRWDMPDQLKQQLRLAHDLREDLVSLELACDADLKAIWSSYPAVASAEAELLSAEERAGVAAAAVKQARAAARGKRIDPSLTSQLREARAAVKTARQSRRDAIAAVKDEAAARRQERREQLRADQKALYRRYCTEGDLYWATFGTVLDHHKVAVKRIAQRRAQGQPATLRHHRFDGTGTVAVQLQRQAGMPPRTPSVLADPVGKYRNVLQLPWHDPDEWLYLSRGKQRAAGRVTVRMRCGSSGGEPQWIDIPVQAHRWLPADADIVGAQLTVTRCGADLRAKLCVTARIGEPEPVTDGPAVAMHLGWLDGDAGTVVASWRSDTPLDIPESLRAVMVADTPTTGRVVTPARIGDRLARHDDTRAARDVALDGLRDELVGWLTVHGPVPHPTREGVEIAAADVARWKSPARFAALAVAWRGNDTGIAGVLEQWRVVDKKLWQAEQHGRQKALRHRDDLYRQVAAVIAGQAGQVVVDDMSVAELARRSAPPESDLPNDVQRGINARRHAAAPGALREFVVSAARREGMPVVVVPSADLSRTHARCGHVNPADDRYVSRPVVCDGCGQRYDQDLSATVLMMARAAQCCGDTPSPLAGT